MHRAGLIVLASICLVISVEEESLQMSHFATYEIRVVIFCSFAEMNHYHACVNRLFISTKPSFFTHLLREISSRLFFSTIYY